MLKRLLKHFCIMDSNKKKVLPHRMFNKLATKTKNFFFVTIKVGKVDELNNTENGCDVKLHQAVG